MNNHEYSRLFPNIDDFRGVFTNLRIFMKIMNNHEYSEVFMNIDEYIFPSVATFSTVSTF